MCTKLYLQWIFSYHLLYPYQPPYVINDSSKSYSTYSIHTYLNLNLYHHSFTSKHIIYVFTNSRLPLPFSWENCTYHKYINTFILIRPIWLMCLLPILYFIQTSMTFISVQILMLLWTNTTVNQNYPFIKVTTLIRYHQILPQLPSSLKLE